jgi:hypothetical protein
MLGIPVNRVVDKTIKIDKNGGPRRKIIIRGHLTPPHTQKKSDWT